MCRASSGAAGVTMCRCDGVTMRDTATGNGVVSMGCGITHNKVDPNTGRDVLLNEAPVAAVVGEAPAIMWSSGQVADDVDDSDTRRAKALSLTDYYEDNDPNLIQALAESVAESLQSAGEAPAITSSCVVGQGVDDEADSDERRAIDMSLGAVSAPVGSATALSRLEDANVSKALAGSLKVSGAPAQAAKGTKPSLVAGDASFSALDAPLKVRNAAHLCA